MKKLLNVRLPVVCALTIASGIFAAKALYFHRQTFYLLFAAIPLFVAAFLVLFYKNRKLVKSILIVATPLLFFTIGGFNTYFTLQRYDTAAESLSDYCEVSGKVVEKGSFSSGSEYVIIDDLSLNGERTDGKIYVYLSTEYGDFCDVGYKVHFTASLRHYDAFSYGELNYNAIEGIKYSASVYGGMQSEYRFSIFSNVRSRINEILYDNLDEESAAVCLALLTGDTQNIDADTLSAFRYGGIAHIFAVSGLHIGILFGIVSFILNGLHANKYLSALICLGIIIFYAGVCGFSLSSVRAVIMCAVAVVAKLVYSKYDSMNSLGVAVILILCVTPLSLFSVGFQLSVCAVGAIVILSKNIERLLRKIKAPKRLAKNAAIAIAAQLGTMPVMLANFGYLSGAGLLLNIILIPVISVIFMMIFGAVLVGLIIPVSAAYLVPTAVLPLEFVLSFLVNMGFESALISGFGAGAFGIIYFTGILFLSDKININSLQRLVAVSLSVILLITYTLVKYATPFDYYKITVYTDGRGGGEVLIKSPHGNVLIITEGVSESSISSFLNGLYVNLDAVFILSEAYDLFELSVNCDSLYLYSQNESVDTAGNFEVNYGKYFDVYGAEFDFFDGGTILVTVEGVEIGVCSGGNELIRSCDILISDGENYFDDCRYQIFFNRRLGPNNIYDCGRVLISVRDYGYTITMKAPPKQ